jgi:cation/acetate symporter
MGQQQTAEDVVAADGGEDVATDGGRATDDAAAGDRAADDAATEE